MGFYELGRDEFKNIGYIQIIVKGFVADVIRGIYYCSQDFGLKGLDALDVRLFCCPP